MLTGIDGDRLQSMALEQAKKYRKKCKQIKAQARKKREKQQNKLQQAQKNFEVSDCEKYANQDENDRNRPTPSIDELPDDWSQERKQQELERMKQRAKERKQRQLKQCKYGYAISQNDCSILKKEKNIKECQKIKENIEYYRKIKSQEQEYGSFRLRSFLKEKIK